MTEELKDRDESVKLDEDEHTDEATTQEQSGDELAQLRQELEELSEQNLRLQAEIQNMHKRNRRDREQATRYRSQDLGRAILPVIDNLERALSIEVTDESGQNLREGIEMVLQSFETALKEVGIEKMDCLGKPFDPNFQEAYTQLPAEEGQESGVVVEVFENGYTLHDRILRAAKVAVSV